MKPTDTVLLRKSVVIFAVLLLVISMLSAVGTAYGRYLTVVSGENDAVIKPKVAVNIIGGEEWAPESLTDGAGSDGQAYRLDFTLTNFTVEVVDEAAVDRVEEREMLATVRFFAPRSENEADVKLIFGEDEYIGVPEPIDPGVFVGKKYGDGIMYRFFDSDGTELTWDFPGGVRTEAVMTAVVTGAELSEENSELNLELSIVSVEAK